VEKPPPVLSSVLVSPGSARRNRDQGAPAHSSELPQRPSCTTPFCYVCNPGPPRRHFSFRREVLGKPSVQLRSPTVRSFLTPRKHTGCRRQRGHSEHGIKALCGRSGLHRSSSARYRPPVPQWTTWSVGFEDRRSRPARSSSATLDRAPCPSVQRREPAFDSDHDGI